MELSNRIFVTNQDWDPYYLRDLVCQDWYDFKELWQSDVIGDNELVKAVDSVDQYCPVLEDISLDDMTLCQAVEEIEKG